MAALEDILNAMKRSKNACDIRVMMVTSGLMAIASSLLLTNFVPICVEWIIAQAVPEARLSGTWRTDETGSDEFIE